MKGRTTRAQDRDPPRLLEAGGAAGAVLRELAHHTRAEERRGPWLVAPVPAAPARRRPITALAGALAACVAVWLVIASGRARETGGHGGAGGTAGAAGVDRGSDGARGTSGAAKVS
jgi:hypothetical protein